VFFKSGLPTHFVRRLPYTSGLPSSFGLGVPYTSGLPTHFVRRLPYTSTRGVPKPFQQFRFAESLRFLMQDCQHSLRSADLQQVGLTQTLSTIPLCGIVAFFNAGLSALTSFG
jgi:hypothetical protein